MSPHSLRSLPDATHALMAAVARRACHRWPDPRLRQFMRARARKWCADEERLVRTDRGFHMYASPHDYTSYGIYFFGDYDPSMSQALSHLVREGHTAWDVGTERGWFTLLLARAATPEV